MTEMLWATQPFSGRGPNKRGVGVAVGGRRKEFLDTNGLSMVVRSHEVKDEGYLVEHGGCWSPCSRRRTTAIRWGTRGRSSSSAGMKPEYTKFDAVEHPPIRPMAYAATGMKVLET